MNLRVYDAGGCDYYCVCVFLVTVRAAVVVGTTLLWAVAYLAVVFDLL